MIGPVVSVGVLLSVAILAAPAPPGPGTRLRHAGFVTLGVGAAATAAFAGFMVGARDRSNRLHEANNAGALGFPDEFYAPDLRRADRQRVLFLDAALVSGLVAVAAFTVTPVLFIVGAHQRRMGTARLHLLPVRRGVGVGVAGAF